MRKFDIEKIVQRLSARRGGTPCPSCGEKQIIGFEEPLVTCHACGYHGSRTEWSFKSMRQGRDHGIHHANPSSPPPDTIITRKEISPEAIAWEIPPSGKSGGMLFFAIFWLVITATSTAGLIFGNAKSEGAIWIPILVIVLFWAVGLSMLYAALRAKYAYHLLIINSETVVLARSLFNQKTTKSLKRNNLKYAQKKEFYQKNNTPVYGLEIRGDDGKIRFGTTLNEEEKNWLVADFNSVLWPEKNQPSQPRSPSSNTPRAKLPVSSLPRETKPFTVTFPPARAKGSVFGIIIFLLIVGGFLAIGIFAMKDAGSFRWIWIGLNGLFALAGISGAVKSIKDRKKSIEVRGDRAGIHVKTLRNNVPIKEESIPCSSTVQVRAFPTGSNGGQKMLRIELIGENQVITILKWYPEQSAEEPLRQLQNALR